MVLPKSSGPDGTNRPDHAARMPAKPSRNTAMVMAAKPMAPPMRSCLQPNGQKLPTMWTGATHGGMQSETTIG